MKTDRDFAERLIGLCIKKGSSHAEVFLRRSKNLSIEVKSGDVEAVESSLDVGYALRVIRDGRLGFSYSASTNDFERVVEAAIETSRWTEEDEFLAMTGPASASSPEVFDPEAASIKEADVMENAVEIERGALEEDKRITKIRKAASSVSIIDTLMVNSNGNMQSYSTTACTAHIMAVAEEAGDSQTGWDFEGSRFLSDLSFEGVGRGAARRALSMLGAKRVSPRKSHVLLDRMVAAEFLDIFASMLSSEAVQKGKSLLKGKIGRKVISGSMDIVDDGLLPHRLGSRPVDDEGFPSSRKVLIKEGVLQGFMYNVHTAKKDGVPSTGNAIRYGISGMPGIGPLNLYSEGSQTPGGSATPLKGLLKGMHTGLYVIEAMGMHTANPISGEFSIGAAGLWVEGGEIKYPVKEAIISGNMLDFFSKVEAMGDDLKFYGNIGSPSLLVGSVDISG